MTKTRTEIEQLLLSRASKDDAFRDMLLRNPRAAIASLTGEALPDKVKVKIVELEDRDTVYFVLPPRQQMGALSEDDLDRVAGGASSNLSSSEPNVCTCDYFTCCTASRPRY